VLTRDAGPAERRRDCGAIPKLKLDELVSATMPLAKINDGFIALVSGEVARQLIVFE
jgi:Zn-dependent alcohol dehydrogenase